MDYLADAVESGLVKAVGVSNFNLEQMKRAHSALAKRGIQLASNQVKFNLLHREPEINGLLELCHELDIDVIAYSPIGGGMLTNKYNPNNPPWGPRRRKYDKEFLSRLQPLLRLMQHIGEAHGNQSPSQVALNWVIGKGAIPIPGAKTELQAEENIGALGWALDEEEVSALDNESLKV
jgi:aryl-alcohol dehydrogenase-like predicted oxidoreductase